MNTGNKNGVSFKQVNRVDGEAAWNDETTLLDFPVRETEALHTDTLISTVDQSPVTYIDKSKPIGPEMLQSFADASLEGMKPDPVEPLLSCVASDMVYACTGSSPAPSSS
jgi:hypothetical protein